MKRVKNTTKPNCPVCNQRLGGSLSREAKRLYCRKFICSYNHVYLQCPKCKTSGYENMQKEVAWQVGPPRPGVEGSIGMKWLMYECHTCGKSRKIVEDLYPKKWYE